MPPGPAVGRHARRASPRTSNGSARCSTTGTRWCRGRAEYGGRDASLWEWLIFEEEYYRGRRAAAGHAERHLPARADDLRVRHARAAGSHPAARWPPASRRGARAGRSRTRAATSPASRAKAVRDEAAAAGGSSGQKTWTTRGAFCTHLFGLFRSDPDAERHHGLTYFLVDLATPGVTVRGVETARRRRRLRRGVLRRRVRARRRRARRAERGLGASRWRRPAPSAGSRCARPAGSSPPRNGSSTSYRERTATIRAAIARPPRRRVDRRRGLPLADVLDRDAHRARAAQSGAESSINKIWWRARRRAARARARPARPARRARRRAGWMKGYEFALRARSTRAPTRSSAT